MMLSGEPYVGDYLANVDADIRETAAHAKWSAGPHMVHYPHRDLP